MKGLLIANKDGEARSQLEAMLQSSAYGITTTDSVANALEGILNKSVQVVLISGRFDEHYVAKFVPLLKKCDRHLEIILVADEMPLELLRCIRKEGIFYHALQPAEGDSWDEIRQAVECAFASYDQHKDGFQTLSLGRARAILSSLYS